MDFIITLHKSEYGYSVSCPTLKGCHSQGETEQEAIINIKIAIKEYMSVLKAINKKDRFRKIKVPI